MLWVKCSPPTAMDPWLPPDWEVLPFNALQGFARSKERTCLLGYLRKMEL